MVDLWTDFWIRETGTGQQVAHHHDRYDDDDDDKLRLIKIIWFNPDRGCGLKEIRKWYNETLISTREEKCFISRTKFEVMKEVL